MPAIDYTPAQHLAFAVADDFRAANPHLWPGRRTDLWETAVNIAWSVISAREPDVDDVAAVAYEACVAWLGWG